MSWFRRRIGRQSPPSPKESKLAVNFRALSKGAINSANASSLRSTRSKYETSPSGLLKPNEYCEDLNTSKKRSCLTLEELVSDCAPVGRPMKYLRVAYSYAYYTLTSILEDPLFILAVVSFIILYSVSSFFWQHPRFFGVADDLGNAWSLYTKIIGAVIATVTLAFIAYGAIRSDDLTIYKTRTAFAAASAQVFIEAYPIGNRLALQLYPCDTYLQSITLTPLTPEQQNLRQYFEVLSATVFILDIQEQLQFTRIPSPALVCGWRDGFNVHIFRQVWKDTKDVVSPEDNTFIEKWLLPGKPASRPYYSFACHRFVTTVTNTAFVLLVISYSLLLVLTLWFWVNNPIRFFRKDKSISSTFENGSAVEDNDLVYNEWNLFWDQINALLLGLTILFIVYAFIATYNQLNHDQNVDVATGSVEFIQTFPFSLQLAKEIDPNNTELAKVIIPPDTDQNQLRFITDMLVRRLLASMQYQLALTPTPPPHLVRRYTYWVGSALFRIVWWNSRCTWDLFLNEFICQRLLPYSVLFHVPSVGTSVLPCHKCQCNSRNDTTSCQYCQFV